MKRIILILALVQFMGMLLIAQSIEEKCVNCKKNELSNYSSALGIENDATGQTSFASGTLNESSGDYSTTLGYKNKASGNYSFAGGQESTATGLRAFAFGQFAEAHGSRSLALGKYVSAVGSSSVAIGRYVKTSTPDAMVIGYGTDINNYMINNIPNSLMIGFNSESATLFVGPSDQTGFGKVGIGTTNPSERLEINGTFKVNGFSYMSTINLDDSDIWYIDELAGHGGLKFRGETDLTSTQMILTEDGMLGIGTTSPTEMLEVTGNILQTSGYNIATSQIKAPDAYGLNLTDQNGNGIFVEEGGNVDFGTLDASSDISVFGYAQIHETLSVQGNSDFNSNVTVDGNIDFTGSLLHNGQLFETSKWEENGSNIYFDGGNVGIATSNPVTDLDIEGDIALGGEGEKFLLHSRFWIGDKFMIVPQNSGGDWEYDNSFVLFDDGTVGIGVPDKSNATAKLTVNGNILAKEVMVRIDAGEGADFVFDDNYELPRLNEIEDYVKEHNHLPDIPSANEMQKKGIELGDMQIALLQKIEELTLYIIEQNNKIEKLESEVDKLRGE